MLAMSGLPQQLSALAAGAGFGLTGFVLLYVALAIVLGCMLDSVSIMVITLPFALPVVKALGGDFIWFGVVAVVAIEIGLLTPPFGISVYVVKSTLDDQRITLRDIFAGAFPVRRLHDPRHAAPDIPAAAKPGIQIAATSSSA